MPDPVTRRKFLASASLGVAAGAAIAAAGGASALGGLARASGSTAAPTATVGSAAGLDLSAIGDDVIAHVRNASTGEVVLYVGNREVVYRDRALVSRLLAGARGVGTEA